MFLPLQASEINRVNCCYSEVLANNLKPDENDLMSSSCKIMCLDITICHLENNAIKLMIIYCFIVMK